MTTEVPPPTRSTVVSPAIIATDSVVEDRPTPRIDWRAVFGGVIVAIGVHVLFSFLGMGIGLATFSPTTDAEPVEKFGVGAAIVWSVCALVGLACGGFVAGRFSASHRSGMTHGVLVWSLSLTVTLLLLSVGTGKFLGGTMKIMGAGLNAGAEAAGSALGDGVLGGKIGQPLLAGLVEDATTSLTNAATAGGARKEIGSIALRYFSTPEGSRSQDTRAALTSALINYGNMDPAKAEQTIANWTNAYNNAVAQAKKTAENAATEVAKVSVWMFFGLLVGLILTALSGQCGARQTLKEIRSTPVWQA